MYSKIDITALTKYKDIQFCFGMRIKLIAH